MRLLLLARHVVRSRRPHYPFPPKALSETPRFTVRNLWGFSSKPRSFSAVMAGISVAKVWHWRYWGVAFQVLKCRVRNVNLYTMTPNVHTLETACRAGKKERRSNAPPFMPN